MGDGEKEGRTCPTPIIDTPRAERKTLAHSDRPWGESYMQCKADTLILWSSKSGG
jgi:hypothetical protein